MTDLKVITTIFRRPLLDEKSSILPLEAFNIFANIEDVYAMNRKFLTALQKEHVRAVVGGGGDACLIVAVMRRASRLDRRIMGASFWNTPRS